jgi:hypothetical protein
MPRTADEAIRCHEDLGDKLGRLGWTARLDAMPGRVPCLYVQNPEPSAGLRTEHIYAAPKEDGMWFWWSWAEAISADAEQAAVAITRALRPGPRIVTGGLP